MTFFALAIVPLLTLDPGARQPQLAASGRQVAVTYGIGNEIFAAVSQDGGKNFAPAVKVGGAGKLSLGRHRGPRVAITRDAIVIAAIAGKQGGGRDSELYAWRSTDGGKSWSEARRMSDVPGAAREGLHALAAGPNGMLAATWLDMREKGMRVFATVSRDAGASWSPNFVVYSSPDGNVCECCHPSAAVGADGSLHVMFRNWLGGSRDMWLARSKDGGKTFTSRVVGTGTWKLNACPMDGGGLAVRANGEIVTAWRREKQVYATDGDKFIDSGWTGKDPALALDGKGRRVMAWVDGMKVVAFDGALTGVAEHGGFPALAAAGDSVFIAWEQPGGARVARLR
ncbi:MAG: exo-alpha-sialidase [Acidobacteria bacterium]|nr:exo-alpha-sialidase [Acidobacteriota bacterium]